MQVRAELALGTRSLHGGHRFAADNEHPDILAGGFLHILLDENGDLRAVKRLDHRLRRFVLLAQNDTDALRAFEQLDDHRRAADEFDDFIRSSSVIGKGRDRQANTVARQELQRSQLVARPADGNRLIQRKHAHHLELPQHRETIERVRCRNPRDDGIEPGEPLAHIAQLRPPRRDVHIAAKIVDRHDLMAARCSRLDNAAVGIELRIAGEQSDFHRRSPLRFPCSALDSTKERPGWTTNRPLMVLRPSSIGTPMSVRLVSVICACQLTSPSCSSVSTTWRSSLPPPVFLTRRSSLSMRSQDFTFLLEESSGTSKRIRECPSFW